MQQMSPRVMNNGRLWTKIHWTNFLSFPQTRGAPAWPDLPGDGNWCSKQSGNQTLAKNDHIMGSELQRQRRGGAWGSPQKFCCLQDSDCWYLTWLLSWYGAHRTARAIVNGRTYGQTDRRSLSVLNVQKKWIWGSSVSKQQGRLTYNSGERYKKFVQNFCGKSLVSGSELKPKVKRVCYINTYHILDIVCTVSDVRFSLRNQPFTHHRFVHF